MLKIFYAIWQITFFILLDIIDDSVVGFFGPRTQADIKQNLLKNKRYFSSLKQDGC